MKEIFQRIIADFHKKGIENYITRDIDIPINTGKIISILGSRRAGKTYLFYQIMEKLSTPIENIIYINFEDERLSVKKEDLQLLIEGYLEMYPDKKFEELHFFFDEIQNIEGWEQFVRRVYDTISNNIYVTGSSAKLLSKEIATSLRGRTISYEIYPLSFKEYLLFNKVDSKDFYSTKGKAKIQGKFKDYLFKGGFPETIFYDDSLRLKILQNYFEVMLYRDIIERNSINDVQKLKHFIKKVISNVSRPLSLNKIYNDFKSQGITISKDTLYEFPSYLEDAYYIFFLNAYSDSTAKKDFFSKKSYVVDTGLGNALSFKFSEDRGRIIENLVFIELKRRGWEVYYHRDNKECDFILKTGLDIVYAIQVTDVIKDETTMKREIDGLIDACKKYNLKKGLVLSYEKEETLTQNSIEIEIKPIWKWLLEDN